MTDDTVITLGLMGGGGTGPELVHAMRPFIDWVARTYHRTFDIVEFDDERWRGPAEDEADHDGFLTAMSAFYEQVQGRGGCILRGAVSAPVLYKVRRRFRQYYKINPLIGIPELAGLTRFTPEALDGLRLTMVRDNTIGAFHSPTELRDGVASMHIEHRRADVERFADYVFELAGDRAVALAMPTRKLGAIGELWEDVFDDRAAARTTGYYKRMYPHLIHISQYIRARNQTDPALHPYDRPLYEFDIIAGPELFMDYLMDDAGWAIHGEPFIGCSGNFAPGGLASYQTVHGTSIPLRGKDMANPIAMLHALAMCLRCSCALEDAAARIERAVRAALATGIRTYDLHRGDARYRLVGTRQMVDAVFAALTGPDARDARAG